VGGGCDKKEPVRVDAVWRRESVMSCRKGEVRGCAARKASWNIEGVKPGKLEGPG